MVINNYSREGEEGITKWGTKEAEMFKGLKFFSYILKLCIMYINIKGGGVGSYVVDFGNCLYVTVAFIRKFQDSPLV